MKKLPDFWKELGRAVRGCDATWRGRYRNAVLTPLQQNPCKHVLWSLAVETSPSGLPKDYTLPSNKYPDGIQIAYDPEKIESQPRATANVTTIDFGGINDNTWEYDIILMTANDQLFCDFIRQNRFFTKDKKPTVRHQH
jgi:hypothetical protein